MSMLLIFKKIDVDGLELSSWQFNSIILRLKGSCSSTFLITKKPASFNFFNYYYFLQFRKILYLCTLDYTKCEKIIA